MIWSDATHLANLGDASLWRVYLFFGNQSKYASRKPSAAACHHVAYIPSVSSTKIYYIYNTDQLPSYQTIFKISISRNMERRQQMNSTLTSSMSLCMQYGGSFSITILSRSTQTVYWSSVLMVLSSTSFLDFLAILITLKSRYYKSRVICELTMKQI